MTRYTHEELCDEVIALRRLVLSQQAVIQKLERGLAGLESATGTMLDRLDALEGADLRRGEE